MINGGARRWPGIGGMRGKRLTAGALALVSVLALMSACGKPQYRYVANTDEHTFFKVPYDWHEIDSGAIDEHFSPFTDDSLNAAILKQLTWSSAFDASDGPTPEHMTE